MHARQVSDFYDLTTFCSYLFDTLMKSIFHWENFNGILLTHHIYVLRHVSQAKNGSALSYVHKMCMIYTFT